MIAKLVAGAATALIVGAGIFVTYDDASAQERRGGASRGGGGGGASRGGASRRSGVRPGSAGRVGRGSPGRFGRPGQRRPGGLGRGHLRVPSLHSRPLSHRRGGSDVHRRGGSHRRAFSWGPGHRRAFSWGGGAVPLGSPGPARPAPAGSATCDACGQWTDDGCYTTYRKFTDAGGKPELRCVKACD